MTPRTVKEFEALTGADALTEAELELIAACRADRPCDRGDDRPAAATTANRIRASLLRLLITGGTADCGLGKGGVALTGCWIEGQLDLSYASGCGRTWLDKCNFEKLPNLEQARLHSLSLEASALPGLWAPHLTVTGPVHLNSLVASDAITLTDATIGGQLACERASFEGNGGPAFNAQGANIGGGIFLRSVKAKGTVVVHGADIGGQLACDGADFDGKGLKALDVQNSKIRADLFLTSVTAAGTVDLAGAAIGGQLACNGAKLDGKGGMSCRAQAVKLGGSLFLRSAIATGTVDVNGAEIGGQLDCTDARFDGQGGRAFNAQGAKTGDSVFFRAAKALGPVAVTGASIGGQFACEGASFNGNGGKALNAESAKIGADFFLSSVTAAGAVDLSGASVGGNLACNGASFDGRGGKALEAQRLRVDQGFIWRGVKRCEGSVDLGSAHVGDLVDGMQSWPQGVNKLVLDGFTYDRLLFAPADAAARLPWLRSSVYHNGEFLPQPYTQLAKVLWDMGHIRHARRVLIERDRLLREQLRRERIVRPDGSVRVGFLSLWSDIRNTASVLWDWLVYTITGYGYRPSNAIVALILLWAIATYVSDATWRAGAFAPNSDVILVSQDWRDMTDMDCLGPLKKQPPPDELPCLANPANLWSSVGEAGMDWDSFKAWGYSLDLVVPVLTLGQTDAWAPSKDRGWWGWTLWWGRWIFQAAGWIVTALGAAAITGIIQRGRE